MEIPNFWHQFDLRGKKIIFLLTFLVTRFFVEAQPIGYQENLPNYDEKWLHYGFAIGLHSSNYRVTYNETFVSSAMDSVHSIMSPNSIGFSLGFISNFRLAQYLDLRPLINFGFYENTLQFRYVNGTTEEPVVETSVYAEFPILFKFKSQRRKNNRMYLIGGIAPAVEATGRKDEETGEPRIRTRDANLSVQFGFGVDIYYPLFKFSPELRFSKGLVNVFKPDDGKFSQGVDRLTTNTVTLYLLFE